MCSTSESLDQYAALKVCVLFVIIKESLSSLELSYAFASKSLSISLISCGLILKKNRFHMRSINYFRIINQDFINFSYFAAQWRVNIRGSFNRFNNSSITTLVTSLPISGNSTKTMSPKSLAWSDMPTVTVPSSSSLAHSWDSKNFRLLGTSAMDLF